MRNKIDRSNISSNINNNNNNSNNNNMRSKRPVSYYVEATVKTISIFMHYNISISFFSSLI